MDRSVFLDKQLSLITPRGVRHGVVVDRQVLQDYGYDTEEAEEFKVGDLREFLFDHWSTIFLADGEEGLERPATADEVQLLHSGKRLDPNTRLALLDLDTSPVFHVLVKPATDGGGNGGRTRRMKNPVRLLQAGSGTKTNDRVPEFAPTHVRSASKASVPTGTIVGPGEAAEPPTTEPRKTVTATATATMTTSTSPKDRPSLATTTRTSPATLNNNNSNHNGGSATPSKKSCCTIM